MSTPAERRRLLLFAVLFTNALSLACQVLWVRKLTFLFGSTAAVFATVLSIFLLGLAFGSAVGGRWADRSQQPWRFLGRLQIVLGVWCAASIPLFDLARRAYLAVVPLGLSPTAGAASKAVVVLLCLFVPTAAIGAVFPSAVRILGEGSRDLGQDLSLIYGLDTLGAALGALLAGFLLVPSVGLWASAGLLGAGAAVLGFRFLGESGAAAVAVPTAAKPARGAKEREKQKSVREASSPRPDAPPEAPPTFGRAGNALVLVAFFATGLAALLLETGWNRFFYVLNGTNVFSLSLVLAGFLAGLGAGSFAMRRYLHRLGDPLQAAAVLFALAALGGVLVLRSTWFFEHAYFASFAFSSSYTLFQLLVGMAIFLIVFLAALAMGANFPLVALIAARDPATRGESVGLVFGVNTLGGVLGALLAEFVILPRAGFDGLTMAALALYAAAAIAFLLLARSRATARPAVFAGGVLVLAIVLSPAVLPFTLPAHALYYHGLRAGSYDAYRQEADAMKVRWQKDGFYGRVAVLEYGPYLLLKHNGKTDASDGGDNYAQLWLSQAPMLMHPAPKDVLNIGLGGGMTLRGMTHHPEAERITSVEIDPLVVEAARTQFAAMNDRAIDDPRVETVIADGRNFIDGTAKSFDVIVSEPPNVWVAGVSGLFTEEFYRAVAKRLKPGGILSQWLPVHELERDDFALALKTMREVFPHVAVWSNGSDAIVLASAQPFALDDAALGRKLAAPGVQRDLATLGLQPGAIAGILRAPQFDEAAVKGLAGSVADLNTDNLPRLEFNTARNLFAFNRPEYRARQRRP